MSVVELGGPRMAGGAGAQVACSAMRVRRLLAGELGGDEAISAEAHVAGCARCQAVRGEVEREKAELSTSTTFEVFAAGVAEKLAGADAQVAPSLPARWSQWRRTAPWRATNLAAKLALVGLVGLVFVREMRPGDLSQTDPLAAVDGARGVRTKGGAGLTVFALRAARSFALRNGEKAKAGDRLLPALEPGGHSQVVVLLVEPGEVSVLYRGPARGGPLPEAFEWTGSGPEARLVAVYADGPLEAEAVVAAVKAGRVAEGLGVEVVERRLER